MATMVASAPTVELRIAASPAWFPVVRSIAGQLAERANFDEDARTDLTLAADEACGLLSELDPVYPELWCAFTLRPNQVHVEIAAPVSRRSSAVPHDTMSWQLLRGITDDLTVQHWPATGRTPSEFRLAFTKHAH